MLFEEMDAANWWIWISLFAYKDFRLSRPAEPGIDVIRGVAVIVMIDGIGTYTLRVCWYDHSSAPVVGM